MRPQRIRQATYRLIEAELRNYHATKKELEQMRLDVLEETWAVEVAVETGPGDPTAAKGMRLAGLAVLEISKRVAAIEKCLKAYGGHNDGRRIKAIEWLYFEGHLTINGVADKLGVSGRTIRRWKNEFVGLVAAELGWE